MNKKIIFKILAVFLIWRTSLFLVAYYASGALPLQLNFLGGGLEMYTKFPWFWGFSNFDGQHYLSIARNGYQPLTYFFFPLFPLLVGLFSAGGSSVSSAVFGLAISNISLVVALFGLYKLITLDFEERIFWGTLFFLLFFPTSFYLGSVYTESLFLALTVWAFYAVRRRKFVISGLLGGLALSTRIVGLAFIPVYLYKALVERKTSNFKKIVGFLLLVSGILSYMYFLYVRTGDPFEFFNSVSIFGEQRSSSLIMLPQVFYRYIVKILPNTPVSYLPLFFTTWLEFLSASFFLVLLLLSFLRLDLDYSLFFLFSYLIPTLSGSFSSFPRYTLSMFPAFILMALIFKKSFKYLIYFIFLIALVISTAMFVRGYWIS